MARGGDGGGRSSCRGMKTEMDDRLGQRLARVVDEKQEVKSLEDEVDKGRGDETKRRRRGGLMWQFGRRGQPSGCDCGVGRWGSSSSVTQAQAQDAVAVE